MLAPCRAAARASAGTARLGSARASLGVNKAPLKRRWPWRSSASVSSDDSSRVSSWCSRACGSQISNRASSASVSAT
jgi:hypothetical protein